jgi:hypothetical protein
MGGGYAFDNRTLITMPRTKSLRDFFECFARLQALPTGYTCYALLAELMSKGVSPGPLCCRRAGGKPVCCSCSSFMCPRYIPYEPPRGRDGGLGSSNSNSGAPSTLQALAILCTSDVCCCLQELRRTTLRVRHPASCDPCCVPCGIGHSIAVASDRLASYMHGAKHVLRQAITSY